MHRRVSNPDFNPTVTADGWGAVNCRHSTVGRVLNLHPRKRRDANRGQTGLATPNAQQAAANPVAPRDFGHVCFRIGAFCNDSRPFIVAPEPSATAARDDFDTPVRGAFIPVLM